MPGIRTVMESPIQLIAGLGNPGSRYAKTRHNAGFWFVDELARLHGGSWRKETRFFGSVCELRTTSGVIRLLKPDTFMNESGRSVGALARYYNLEVEQILIAHDEIDLPSGVVRLKRGGGHGGHNGLRDIIANMAEKNFVRLRIGVGHPGHSDQVVGYVLNRATATEQDAVDAAVLRATECFNDIADGKLAVAMNGLHRDNPC
jgi:PTH1 family peptidyl-tRNA hydrolase